jgi:hypothetical protein
MGYAERRLGAAALCTHDREAPGPLDLPDFRVIRSDRGCGDLGDAEWFERKVCTGDAARARGP